MWIGGGRERAFFRDPELLSNELFFSEVRKQKVSVSIIQRFLSLYSPRSTSFNNVKTFAMDLVANFFGRVCYTSMLFSLCFKRGKFDSVFHNIGGYGVACCTASATILLSPVSSTILSLCTPSSTAFACSAISARDNSSVEK